MQKLSKRELSLESLPQPLSQAILAAIDKKPAEAADGVAKAEGEAAAATKSSKTAAKAKAK